MMALRAAPLALGLGLIDAFGMVRRPYLGLCRWLGSDALWGRGLCIWLCRRRCVGREAFIQVRRRRVGDVGVKIGGLVEEGRWC